MSKKGFTRAEAVLRAELANQAVPRDLEVPRAQQSTGPPKYHEAYAKFLQWQRESLDLYRPELQRFLWPLFVYSFIELVYNMYTREARMFWTKFSDNFKPKYTTDLRQLENILLPEHQAENNLAKLYKENRYRIPITHAAFQYLMQYLESLPDALFKLEIGLIEKYLDIRKVQRTADNRFSFESVLRNYLDGDSQQTIADDEGIPGHRAGSAISSTDPNVGNTLAALKLGKLPLEAELNDDVRAELSDLDLAAPPVPGAQSLVETHDAVIKVEPIDGDSPNRTDIPYPPTTARDVAMEVQKIRENRDRLRIESRTGGIGPALSCVMYTFHNTRDNITCLEFSGDNSLVAAGTSLSYIRVWSMEGTQLGTDDFGQPVNSKRLIGHAGPVYSLSFAPSTVQPPNTEASTAPQWLLSSGQDGTIRLWNLTIWSCVVIYRGHIGPVWSVRFSPFGTYFLSGGSDKTARVWTTSKPSPRRFLIGHDADVDVVAWHPNTAYAFTASSDKTVRMWSIANGTAVRMFTGHNSAITALSCSRSGKLLASGDDSGLILLWDLAAGKLLKQLRGHGKGGVWSLSWSVESTVLVSGGADHTVRVWDVYLPAKDGTTAKPGEPGTSSLSGPTISNSNNANTSAPNSSTTSTAQVGKSVNSVSNPTAVTSVNNSSAPKRKGKNPNISAEQISAFLTKKTVVQYVGVTEMNLIIAGGEYLPEN